MCHIRLGVCGLYEAHFMKVMLDYVRSIVLGCCFAASGFGQLVTI